ncbi:Micronuclear linker histone polyprotein-like [Melia azedarach]|uniref:Micronuclear linker histone polyprotein-like n=1 Tax=Melia azedarach TaxID=155640 RepID=A0ACC1XNL8_MELAZ|nr:Micronuclear linker histone polyprotein-like [Melia azedarach]
MATSAFKSTTRRTSIGTSPNSTTDDSSSSTNRSSTAHRRSRSLSRFSRRLPAHDVFSEDAPRGKFVNTVRGSGFPEISLDDLAIELFDSSGDRGSLASTNDDVRGRNEGRDSGGGASVRRGRSVSRQGVKANGGGSSGGGRIVSENNNNNNSRRRRSVSVVRYQISDSESDLDHSQHSSNHSSLKNKIDVHSRSTAQNHRPALRRSVSQKDLKYNDGYSSQSSALTDDEWRDTQCSKNGIERTIRAVYAQKKGEHPTGDDLNSGLYDVMRKELRNAVEEIRMELEQAVTTKVNDNCMQSKNLNSLQTVSTIRRNYATKLEQSEKRKQDLLAEMLLEEQRGRELSKIMKELLPDPKDLVAVENPSRVRKRSNDRSRMSKRLTEEAEKYIEDFISNVEDTDISSLDGERSDTSSTLGGIMKNETFQSPAISKPSTVEMDGVVLPWLQWETTNDASPQSCKAKTQPQATPKTKFWDASQESTAQDLSYQSTSSRGSWSPGVMDGSCIKFGETGSYQSQFMPNGTTRLRFDVDEYLKFQKEEDFLMERLSQQQRINSGGILLCNQMFFTL